MAVDSLAIALFVEYLCSRCSQPWSSTRLTVAQHHYRRIVSERRMASQRALTVLATKYGWQGALTGLPDMSYSQAGYVQAVMFS